MSRYFLNTSFQGVGYPLDIVVCSALGADMYDCVYPTRTARFGTALVPEVIASCEYKLWNHTFTTFLIFKFFNLLLISNTVFLTVNLYMNGLYTKTFCFIRMFLMNTNILNLNMHLCT